MNPPEPKSLIVAGVMSGTSADGVDVALCRISPGKVDLPGIKLLARRAFPYPRTLRLAVLAAMNATQISAADLARLSWRLGEVYSDAIAATAAANNLKPQLAAIHGQTIYHQAIAKPFLGKPLRCTWQIGEASVIAERLRLPVISDFRPADLAAGGQGAPLVPMLDLCLFRHPTKSRLLLNLGGIANITALPAGCDSAGGLAFDIGPANMLIDACMTQFFDKRLDRNGATAARGRTLQPILDNLTPGPLFMSPPPKSFGREEFGADFAIKFIATCQRVNASPEDIVATATALTATTILDAYRRFCWPHLGQRAPLARATEIFVAGGGARNRTLMRLLNEGFSALRVKVATTASVGLPVEAKEAAAFALLGWLTWHQLPGNIPSATGASHPAILGKVTLA
jgi:anhydro-N-acetylmuramic acid kinase